MSDVTQQSRAGQVVRSVLAIPLLFAAAIQFNDPDPLYWVAVYTAAAAVIAGQAFGFFSKFWSAAVIGAVLAGMSMTLSGFLTYLLSWDFGVIVGDMLASKPFIEQTREFIGLGLALALLVWSYASAAPAQSPDT